MTQVPRKNLKKHFEKGQMPKEEDFSDLIDSMLNMLDEGFEKTPKDGLKLAQLGDGKLLSFYKGIGVGNALWSLELDKSSDSLSFQDTEKQALLTLATHTDDEKRRGRVGVGKSDPMHELDVAGTVASHARVGQSGDMSVPADGNWYDVTDDMTGCQAFEVVAGAGAKDSEGRYALMHAFALNAFGENGDITYHQSHFGNKCSRIELRWLASKLEKFTFKLQMRVGCSYGDQVWIKYHITKLWQDTLMLESCDEPPRSPTPQYDAKGKVRS